MNVRITILVVFAALWTALAAAQIPKPPTPVLMPPIPPSPVDQFRQWLRMPETEREASLADYPEPKRVVLRQKLQAYAVMPADQRERRLRMLELSWYLRPLMEVSLEQRGDYLKMIPARLHETIASRLEKWDGLAAETRREILASEDARDLVTRYFVQVRRTPVSAPDLHPLDEQQRASLRDALKRWNEMSQSQRERVGEHLATFFDLSAADQQRTLARLSDAERQEMQKTLEAFARLSAQNRRAVVESFQKFATMAPEERGAFLRNAARWQQMTAQERETWKRLVNKLPPMPPEPVVPPPVPQAIGPAADRVASRMSPLAPALN
jgi:hypothetical protein